MNKLIMTTAVGAVFLSTLSGAALAEVYSLRGDNPLDAPAKAVESKRLLKVEGGFERSWKLQPPPIPHGIEKDRITLQENTCLRCHSKENHEKEKAPMVGESHFKDRDGNVLEKVSARRYFCNQCHAPQVDAPPLVENIFQGAM